MGNSCGTADDAKPAGKASNGTQAKTVFNPKKKKEDEKVEKIELTEGVVKNYVDLEKEIYKLEKKNVVKKLEAKTLYADEIKKTVDQLEATYKELKKQTEKEKADVDNIEQPSVRAFLKQQGTWDQKFNKAQQDYLECVNKQEVAEKELTGAKRNYDRASKICEIYKRKADRLTDLYDKQDKLLSGIFGGEYGSDLENTLEEQLDHGLEWQQRVSLAKFKWTNGRVLLVHACTQMAFGITRWKELETIDDSNTRMRYFAGAEARNNFVAAGQNIQSCRVYLGKVKFPYCTEEEMKEMDNSVTSAFNDLQNKENYKKALDVYKSTHKKVAALIQWFDQVISETIIKDLEKANHEVGKIQTELRKERMRLINVKVREKYGRDIQIDYMDISDDKDEDDDELLALEADRVNDDHELPGERLNNLLNMSKPDGRQPTPLPAGQLAALPSSTALFGDVTAKMKEFEEQRKILADQQLAQEAKAQMSVEDKIKARQQAAGGGGKGPPKTAKSAKGDKGAKDKKSKKRRSRVERRASVMPAKHDVPKAK